MTLRITGGTESDARAVSGDRVEPIEHRQFPGCAPFKLNDSNVFGVLMAMASSAACDSPIFDGTSDPTPK